MREMPPNRNAISSLFWCFWLSLTDIAIESLKDTAHRLPPEPSQWDSGDQILNDGASAGMEAERVARRKESTRPGRESFAWCSGSPSVHGPTLATSQLWIAFGVQWQSSICTVFQSHTKLMVLYQRFAGRSRVCATDAMSQPLFRLSICLRLRSKTRRAER